MNLKLLHITPHLGGGVGSVVLNWFKKDTSGNFHTVISLDKNNNKDWAELSNISPKVTIFDDCFSGKNSAYFLRSCVEATDIVIVHWWNHPLLYEVLVNFTLPACRLIIWNHVSGLYPPYVISSKIVAFADKFVHTSPVSFEANDIKSLDHSQRANMDVIWSTVGSDGYDTLQHIIQNRFIVGITGTVDFGKLHPQFMKMCADVSRSNVHFIVCSGDSQQHLKDQAKEMEIEERISFLGRIPDVKDALVQYSVFGYPLQPNHFGTCEQSLGEAMMAGCVPVVLNNPSERYIVEHMKTGIIADSPEEYSRAIEYLYDNPELLKKLSDNARVAAKEKYDIKKTISQWSNLCSEVMKLPKRERAWDNCGHKRTPAQVYAESLGTYGKAFYAWMEAETDGERSEAEQQIRKLFQSNLMFRSRSKGSVLQYLSFFPDDNILREWSNLI